VRVLITGISGFVGSHLAEYLMDATDWHVAGTVYGPYGSISHLCGVLELYPAELSRLPVVTFVLEQARPDLIFHLAAQPLVSLSRKDPWGTLETNVRMQLNLLEGMAAICPKSRMLIVGSSEEYGLVSQADMPIDEDTPLRPLSAYALSKVAQDLMGLQYHLTHGLHVVRTRPFNHIGARQRLGFVAPDFAHQIAEVEAGQRPPVVEVGTLDVYRDFSDVRDIVRGYVAALTDGKPGQVYNLGTGEAHSVREILETLISFTGVEIEVRADPTRVRKVDMPLMVSDCRRIQEDTGWQVDIPFEQSLRDIFDYWREQVRQSA
jgi:GDP-4-dehydro-6-deoxy-D-mannose reductase